jgi:hypothetical protein
MLILFKLQKLTVLRVDAFDFQILIVAQIVQNGAQIVDVPVELIGVGERAGHVGAVNSRHKRQILPVFALELVIVGVSWRRVLFRVGQLLELAHTHRSLLYVVLSVDALFAFDPLTDRAFDAKITNVRVVAVLARAPLLGRHDLGQSDALGHVQRLDVVDVLAEILEFVHGRPKHGHLGRVRARFHVAVVVSFEGVGGGGLVVLRSRSNYLLFSLLRI